MGELCCKVLGNVVQFTLAFSVCVCVGGGGGGGGGEIIFCWGIQLCRGLVLTNHDRVTPANH